MKKIMLVLLVLMVVPPLKATEMPDKFYVYDDVGSRLDHYIPSGWMGSYKSLKMSPGWALNPQSGKTCIRIDYDVNADSGTAWGGIYWQFPVNNWGNKKGGYDLTGYKTLRFWAKGSGYIGTVGMGGIAGQEQEGDLDSATVENIDLTPEWKEYVIDLKDRNLSHVIGGFYFSTSADYNKKNVVFYLDNIRYEK